ncbi:MAG TPA: carbamoyltransferase C-terminal domain-containing protein [Vicinamibacterales bacterium]|nr:carbamoyltransferase C-terminal domain-containing protein [Vicinamibacterales bacterium]
MRILGVNCYGHDASATLVVDGVPVCAVEEERFLRKKHTGVFPENAIRCCLEMGGIEGRTLDAVGFYWDPTVHRARQALHMARYFPASLNLLKARGDTARLLSAIKPKLSAHLGVPESKVHYVEHHMAHAASAFFVSPFEDAAIFSYDGVGEWTTTLYAMGRGNHITKHSEVYFPHSLGDFYSMMTEYLGFRHSGGEGKVMGLASYGDASKYYDRLRPLVQILGDGQYRLDTSYLRYHTHGKYQWFSPKLVELLGPARPYESEMTQKCMDIAAAMQKVVEDSVLELLKWHHQQTQTTKLTISGGVGLNSVVNGRIITESPFTEVFVQPAANDASGSFGAAYHLYHQVFKQPRRYVMSHAYLGPEIPEDRHRAAIEKEGLTYEKLSRDEIIERTASMLADGKIVGWFQGRMEYGPRSLGNRSILSAPFPAEMKDILNARVKHREPFRPFAPSLPAELVGEYFEHDYPSPFMLMVYKTRAEKKSKIPAVDHVDGTGRVQGVERDTNPLYYDLITRFGQKTGVPVLLNTSFNVRGEPIMHAPEQALDCFLGEDMDALVLGSLFLDKRQVPMHKRRAGGAKALD